MLVRRVHWLRAQAQKMRWREEVTLLTYEMQWTVRYFIHKSKFWSDIENSLAENRSIPAVLPTRSNMDIDIIEHSSGVLAYLKHKNSTWYQLALKADKIFKAINNAYKSPL